MTNVELAWYCTVDSKEQVRAVFLRLDVNVLVFYRFPKSFYPVASPDCQSCVDICLSVSLDAASFIFGVSNAAAEFSRNSFYQRLINTGDSSYFAASSLSVSRSLKASMATYALNLASYYFLVCFMVQSYCILT